MTHEFFLWGVPIHPWIDAGATGLHIPDPTPMQAPEDSLLGQIARQLYQSNFGDDRRKKLAAEVVLIMEDL